MTTLCRWSGEHTRTHTRTQENASNQSIETLLIYVCIFFSFKHSKNANSICKHHPIAPVDSRFSIIVYCKNDRQTHTKTPKSNCIYVLHSFATRSWFLSWLIWFLFCFFFLFGFSSSPENCIVIDDRCADWLVCCSLVSIVVRLYRYIISVLLSSINTVWYWFYTWSLCHHRTYTLVCHSHFTMSLSLSVSLLICIFTPHVRYKMNWKEEEGKKHTKNQHNRWALAHPYIDLGDGIMPVA